MAGWRFSLKDDNADTLESSGRLIPGWYMAVLEKEEVNQKDANWELTFCVLNGPFEGQRTVKKLKSPQFENDPKKIKNAENCAKTWGYRLGLISQADWEAKKEVEIDFAKAIGAKRVIEIVKRNWTDPQGINHEYIEIGYTGVYPFDHEKIPADFRAAHNLGPARKTSGGGGGGGSGGSTTSPMSPIPSDGGRGAAELANQMAADLLG